MSIEENMSRWIDRNSSHWLRNLATATLLLCNSSVLAAGPSADTAWLEARTWELLQGCRVVAKDGSVIYTPDGKGNYRALWTRDFAYMAENAGYLIPLGELEACVQRLVDGIREDGATPDRVRPDGVPVYTAGPEDHPMGEPNIDNAQFLVIAADVCLKRLSPEEAKRRFQTWAPKLDLAMRWLPRSEQGLIWNDPARPHSPYGFTDTVAKTGELLFESLLYWTAAQKIGKWHEEVGDKAQEKAYRAEAKRIEKAISVLWNDEIGAFNAATDDCRQIDVWGNAYAIWIDFPSRAKRKRILSFLEKNQQQFLWHGQVRHLLKGEYWQRTFASVEHERYQNGAYWATASGWMMFALAQRDREAGQSVWKELLQDFRSGGICECVNEGYRQLPSYVVSACNPLAAARRLKF